MGGSKTCCRTARSVGHTTPIESDSHASPTLVYELVRDPTLWLMTHAYVFIRHASLKLPLLPLPPPLRLVSSQLTYPHLLGSSRQIALSTGQKRCRSHMSLLPTRI